MALIERPESRVESKAALEIGRWTLQQPRYPLRAKNSPLPERARLGGVEIAIYGGPNRQESVHFPLYVVIDSTRVYYGSLPFAQLAGRRNT